MKRKAVAFLLITGLIVSLAGCRGAESANGTDDGGKGTGEATQDVSNTVEQDTQSADGNTGSGETPADDSENGEDISEAEGSDTGDESDVQPGMEDTDGPHALCITGSNNYLSEWLETEPMALYNIRYQKLYLEQDEETADQKAESALAEVFDSYNEKMSADMEANAEDLKRMAQEALENDTLNAAYTITQQYQIVRADDVVFSAWSKTDTYSGGAHPFYVYDGIAIDTVTGKELQLSDVVTDTSAMAKQLAKQLTDSYDEAAFSDLPITLQSMMKSNTLEWALGNEGLEFCFAPGNLAPYAVGVISTVIRYEEMPELFNEKYTETCKRYTRGFSLDDVQRLDINGDGEPEELLISRDFNEYGDMSTGIRIQIDSEEYAFEALAYNYTCYLVHLEDGKWYLYVNSVSDNDYRTLHVFDLNGEEPEEIQVLDGTGFHADYWEDTYEYPEDFFTNPDEFKLDVRTDLLSTILAFRSYRVGSDGSAETKEEYYYYDTDRELTSKVNLELEFPESGEKEIVPAGSNFSFYRTDNEKFVDMKLDDGRICRIEVDNSDWPVLINGNDREDVFDGMIFAG